MTFQLNRGANNTITKKIINNTTQPKVSANAILLSNPNNVNVNKISLAGTDITATGTELNYSDAISGVASANKALILDNNRDIIDINNLECNDLYINGTQFTGITSSGDSDSLLLQNTNSYNPTPTKVLISDSDNNINNINNISTNSLNLNNNEIIVSNNNYIENNLPIFESINNINIKELNLNTNGLTLPIWISELNLYIAGGTDNTNNYILKSNDFISWSICNTISGPNVGIINKIEWSPELNRIVVVTSGDGNNSNISSSLILYSSDTITWTTITPSIQNSYYPKYNLLIWVASLSKFVAAGYISIGSVYINCFGYSSNGISWTHSNRTTQTIQSLFSINWMTEINTLIINGNKGSATNSIAKSTDGMNWTYSNPTNSPLYAIYKNNKLIGLSSYSNDYGQTWIARTDSSINSTIVWSNLYKCFLGVITVSPNSLLVYSYNGINWFRFNININSYYGFLINGKNDKLICKFGKSYAISGNNYIFPNLNTDINKLTMSFNNNIIDLIYVNELNSFIGLCNTGNNNRIVTSIDGIIWTTRITPNNNWTSLCWAKELTLLVAVANSGTGNRVMTSSDGITWTDRTSASDNDWTSICWGSDLSLFVAVASSGTGNRVMTSSDGITWVTRTSASNLSWTKVSYMKSYSTFIATANDIDGTTNRLMYSSNGISWSINTETNTILNKAIIASEYSYTLDMLIILVNDTNSKSIKIYSHNNPTTTTFIYLGILDTYLYTAKQYTYLKWINELSTFIILDTSSNTTNNIIYSNDGLNWNYYTKPTMQNLRSCAWSKNSNTLVFTSANNSNSQIFYIKSNLNTNNYNSKLALSNLLNSTETYNYTENISLLAGSTTSTTNNLIYVNELNKYFIANNGTLYSSTDAKKWNSMMPPMIGNHTSICWSPELELFVSINQSFTGKRVMISNNGYHWSLVSTPADNNWTSLCWASEIGLFVAVASSGVGNRVMTSPNGITWTIRSSTADNSWNSICWSAELGLFVAVASSGTGRVMTSPDGISWTARTSASETNSWYSVCWSAELGLFTAVAILGSGRVMTSYNGINWTIRVSASETNSWIFIKWIKELNLFIACNNDLTINSFMTSVDGINWIIISKLNTNKIYSIEWVPKLNLLVAIGYVGTIGCCFTSSDGINWSSKTIPIGLWGTITWSPKLNLFITMSNNQGYSGFDSICLSPDGINWTAIGSDINTTLNIGINYTDILWIPSKQVLIAIADDSITNKYSFNGGLTWISFENSTSTVLTASRILYIPIIDRLVILSKSASVTTKIKFMIIGIMNNKLRLTEAITSTTFNSILVYNMFYTDHNKMLFITTANGIWYLSINSYIETSSISFTLVNTTSGIIFNEIAYSKKLNLYIALINGTSATQYYTSYDGINWALQSPTSWQSTDMQNSSIIWADKYNAFIISCNTVTANTYSHLYSYDGFYWYNVKLNVSRNSKLNRILYNPINDELIGFSSASNTNSYIYKYDPTKILNKTFNLSKYDNIISNNSTHLINSWNLSNASSNNQWKSIIEFPNMGLLVAVANSGTGNRVMTSSDGINWISRSSASDNNWTSITYSEELGLLVAVANSGTGNRVMTSSDGINWISRTSASNNNWSSVCWSAELQLFAAVAVSGTGNRVMTSSDGITWTSRMSAANNDWTSICWAVELGLFVAVSSSGVGNRVMTSYNGINWSIRLSAVDNNWTSVCWSSNFNTCIAVASSGSENRVMTSHDCINWTIRTSAADNNWTSVLCSGLAGIVYAISNSGSLNRIMQSNDGGYSWASISSNNNSWECLCWARQLGKYIAVSSDGANRVMYSNNLFNGIKNNLNTYANSGFNLTNSNNTIKLGNSMTTSSLPLSIAGTNGTNCLRLSRDNTNYSDLNISSDSSQLNIINNGINAYTNFNSNNLYFNNIILKPSVNDFNKLNVTNGIASANKVLITDSSNNISNINNISCNAIINNNNYITNKYDSVLNTTPGTASSSKCLILDSDRNITNIKSLSANKVVNNNITIKSNFDNTMEFDSQKKLRNITLSNNAGANPLVQKIIWVNELNLYICTGKSEYNSNNNLAIYNIHTSSDGINWIPRETFYASWNSIAWSPTLGMAIIGSTDSVSTTPSLAYSYDGINWNIIYLVTQRSIRSIIWAFDKFYAFTSTLDIYLTSTDGKRWTEVTINGRFAALNWNSVAFNPNSNILVVIANGGTTSNQIARTVDGTTWTLSTSPQANPWTSLIFESSLSLFVAISSSGTNQVMTSPDGSTWTVRTAASANNWNSLAWLGDRFMAVSSTGVGNRIMTSTNGISWNAGNTTNYDINSNAIAYSSELNLVTIGAITTNSLFKNYQIIYSTDKGTNWNLSRTSYDLVWNKIIWVSSLNSYMAVGGITNDKFNIGKSSDGINWTLYTSNNLNSIILTDIIWISSLSLLIAVGSGNLVTSSDGINWTNITISNTHNICSLTWSSSLSLIVGVSSSGTNQIYTSTNGITWNGYTTESAIAWNSISWSPLLSTFITTAVISNITYLMSSTNGTSWVNVNLLNSSLIKLNKIFWDSNLNIFIGTNNELQFYTSYDGNTWITNITSFYVNNIKYVSSLKYYIAIGQESNNANTKIYYSSDLITWYSNILNSCNQIRYNTLEYSSELNSLVITSNINPSVSTISAFPFIKIDLNISNINSTKYISDKNIINTNITNTAVNNWYSSSALAIGSWRAIAWSPTLNLFVAVGLNNPSSVILTSSNGIDWSYQSVPISDNLSSIIWVSTIGKFIIGSISGKFLVSADATTWTTVNTGIALNYSAMEWSPSLNLLVAVASSGPGNRVRTSPDGITWTAYVSASDTVSWNSIAWSPSLNLFAAIGNAGVSTTLMTSSNGTTWTSRSLPTILTWNSIAWSSSLGLFVAVASNGTTANGVITSSDGINWISRTTPIAAPWIKIIWISSLSLFVAVSTSASSTNSIMTSADGIIWTTCITPNSSQLVGISWSPSLNRVVVLSQSSTSFPPIGIYSSNAINWDITTLPSNLNIDSIAYSQKINTYVCIVTNATNKLYYSTDNCLTWTKTTNASVDAITSLYSIVEWCEDLQLFIAISSDASSTFGYTSPNGITWTLVTTMDNAQWTSLTYSSELRLAVVVANNGTNNRVMTSTNTLKLWSRQNSIPNNNWTSVCWSAHLTLFAAVANSGTGDRVMTSPDGIIWTSRTSVADNNWSSICWSPKLLLFVAVANSGTGNRVMTSSDGIIWTSRTSVADNNWNSVCWSDDLNIFLAVASSGTNNRAMYSYDGINWVSSTMNFNNNWNKVIYNSTTNQFICISTTSSYERNIILSKPVVPLQNNTINVGNDFINVDQNNGNVGIKIKQDTTINNPTAQLELFGSTATAYKPNSTTWTVTSDIRLKEEIEDADINMCYDLVKNLRLVKYNWDLEKLPNVVDTNCLGWIAQEVEAVLPKSVYSSNSYGISDCRSLDIDQIIASLYGAIQKLIEIEDNQKNDINDIKNKIIYMKNFLQSLE